MNRIINKLNVVLLSFGTVFVLTGGVLEIIEASLFQTSAIVFIEIFFIISGLIFFIAFMIRVLYKFKTVKKELSEGNKDNYINSIYDSKTKLYNKTYLQTNFTEIFDNNPAIFKNCICVFIDIDNFKILKENFGLDEANHTLKKLGEIISSSKREGDFAFCYAEQEFLIFYMNTEQDFINKKLSEIKEVFNNFTNKEFPLEDTKFSLSIGTANYNYAEDIPDIIHRANKAMYVSKYSGKDKVTNLD